MKYYAGGWFFIKSIGAGVGEGQLIAISKTTGIRAGIILKSGTIQAYWNGNYSPISGVVETNQWLWLGVGIRHVTSVSYDLKFYVKTLTGAFTAWESRSSANLNVAATDLVQCNIGLVGGASQSPPVRLGAASLYTFSNTDMSDVVYPSSDVDQPETGPYSWYVDTLNGDDNNTGIAANSAWKTASKINSASQWLGVFPRSGGYSSGDTIYVDTSGTDMDLAGTTLTLQTESINFAPVAGQSWVRFKLHKTIDNSSFSLTTGTAHVYETADASLHSVLWENDKWLTHPNGSTIASVTNALDTTPGSFWTDGAKMYVHPIGSTVPTSDGKVYERSYAYSGGSAVLLQSRNMRISGVYGGKTCVAQKTDGDPLGYYVIGSSAPFAGTSLIERCFLFYGSKHALGLVAADTDSTVTINDVQCEQDSPYGSSAPFVSYMGSGSGNTHTYNRAICVYAAGLIGSTNGQTGSAFTAHGVGSPITLVLNDTYFPYNEITVSDMPSVTLTGGTIGRLNTSINDSFINRCLLNYWGVNASSATPSDLVTISNSVIRPESQLTSSANISLSNSVRIIGCTIDMTRIPSATFSGAPLLNRKDAISVTFSNNVVIVPPDKSYTVFGNFLSTDTLNCGNNVYKLGSGNLVAYQFDASDKTFTEWQALGLDSGSVSQDPCLSASYRPYAKTPCWTTGAELGPATDFSGKLYQSRRTAGAYEYDPPSPRFLIAQ